MDFNKFKLNFHESWHNVLKPFIESKECDDIYAFLRAQTKEDKKIAPISIHLWKCFKETSLDDLKVVLIGKCPYDTLKNDAPVADGLLLGCSITEKVEPPLNQFYRAIEKEFYNGMNLNIIENPDVSFIAHQGVLMFNAALTTEIGKSGSHIEIWKPFVKYLFKEVINPLKIPVVFLGKEAGQYKKYITTHKNIFELPHPEEFAYKGIDWNTEETFVKINRILEKNNQDSIQWVDLDVPF